MDDASVIAGIAAEIVAVTLDCTAAGVGRADASDKKLIFEGGWAAPSMHRLTGKYPMRDDGSYIDDLLANRVAVVEDMRTGTRTAALDGMQVGALVNAAVVTQRRGASFIREVAERTRAAIEGRRLEEQLGQLAVTLQVQVEERTLERDRIWQVSRNLLG